MTTQITSVKIQSVDTQQQDTVFVTYKMNSQEYTGFNCYPKSESTAVAILIASTQNNEFVSVVDKIDVIRFSKDGKRSDSIIDIKKK